MHDAGSGSLGHLALLVQQQRAVVAVLECFLTRKLTVSVVGEVFTGRHHVFADPPPGANLGPVSESGAEVVRASAEHGSGATTFDRAGSYA